MFAVFSEKHLCVYTFMFHIVLGAVGKEMMEKGRRIVWIFVCVLKKREKNECVYLVFIYCLYHEKLARMTYLLYIGMFKSGTVTKDGTTLGNPYSCWIKNLTLVWWLGRYGCVVSCFDP